MPKRTAILSIIITAVVALALCSPAFGAEWHTLTSENFYIHYADGYATIAESTAEIAERVRPVIDARVGHTPKGRMHILIADVSDAFNAMTLSGTNNEIVLYCSPPTDLYFLGTADDWLELVFTHEYVHAVQQDMANGVYGIIRSVFGYVPGLSRPNEFMPPAFIEGLAVYNETIFSGGRGTTAAYDMFLRAEAIDDKLPALDEMLGFYDLDRWVPGGHPYLYGYSLHDYLAETFGDDAIREINYEMSKKGLVGGIGSVISSVTGQSPDTIYRGWKRWLTDRYTLQKADIMSRGLTKYTLLGSKGWEARYPEFSPDGRMLAYGTSGGDVGMSVRIRDLSKNTEKALCSGAFGNFCWTPDGRYIVYSAYTVHGDKLVTDLFAADASTGKVTRLTRDASAQSPSITKDGRRIAYIQLDAKSMSSHVIVASLESDKEGRPVIDNPVRWLENSTGSYASNANWDPSGTYLAVEMSGGKGKTGIYRLVSANSKPQPIAEGTGYYTAPFFTADGRYVLYESDRTGVDNIYAWDTGTSSTKQVTNLLGGGFYPASSPDGKSLVFAAYNSQGYTIASMPLDPKSWKSPEPDFQGPQWERAAWRSRIDDNLGSNPVKNKGAAELKTSKYSLKSSLLPTWWLPELDIEEGHYVLGGTTGMSDAKLNHTYSVTAGYDFYTNTPGVSLGYQYIQYPFSTIYGGGGLTVDANGTYEPIGYGSAGWGTELSLVLGYNSSLGTVGGSQRISRVYGGFDTHGDIAAGYSGTLASGAGELVRNSSFGAAVNSAVTNKLPTIVSGYLNEEIRYRREGAISGGIGLGFGNTGQSLAAASDTLAVRGISTDEGVLNASSTLGARVTLGGEHTLVKINRGIGTWPIFFGSIRLHPFIDAGMLIGESHINQVASMGVELSSEINLYYGAAPLTAYLGICVVDGSRIDKPDPRIYLEFR